MNGLEFLSYLLAGFGLLITALLLASVKDAIADLVVQPVLERVHLSERAKLLCMIVPVTILSFGAAILSMPG
jgi:hypothetical protein